MATVRLHLTDETIKVALLKNQKIIERFPFLRPTKMLLDSLSKCSSCQRSAKGKQLLEQIHSIQARIALMTTKDKQDLKELLGAPQVRVSYKVNRGGTVVLDWIDF